MVHQSNAATAGTQDPQELSTSFQGTTIVQGTTSVQGTLKSSWKFYLETCESLDTIDIPEASSAASFWDHFERTEQWRYKCTFDQSPCVRLFRYTISPNCKHRSNAAGGKWVIDADSNTVKIMWFDLVCALVGGKLDGLGVCGCVLQHKRKQWKLQIWVGTQPDRDEITSFRNTVSSLLNKTDVSTRFYNHTRSERASERSLLRHTFETLGVSTSETGFGIKLEPTSDVASSSSQVSTSILNSESETGESEPTSVYSREKKPASDVSSASSHVSTSSLNSESETGESESTSVYSSAPSSPLSTSSRPSPLLQSMSDVNSSRSPSPVRFVATPTSAPGSPANGMEQSDPPVEVDEQSHFIPLPTIYDGEYAHYGYTQADMFYPYFIDMNAMYSDEYCHNHTEPDAIFCPRRKFASNKTPRQVTPNNSTTQQPPKPRPKTVHQKKHQNTQRRNSGNQQQFSDNQERKQQRSHNFYTHVQKQPRLVLSGSWPALRDSHKQPDATAKKNTTGLTLTGDGLVESLAHTAWGGQRKQSVDASLAGTSVDSSGSGSCCARPPTPASSSSSFSTSSSSSSSSKDR